MPDEPAEILTCRLSLVRWNGDGTELVELDLGRVDHEATAESWFEVLPDDVEEGEEWFAVVLWRETAAIRWPLDERVVTDDVAEALAEDRLDERIVAALSTSDEPVR